ncbi:hypothetical protein [Herbaspirillum sp. alder98]|uniref:hypothetical protein n=1 Tax=Herbaspirillum sp. alder98 TaxID=2913096 RepID=UPI001CD8A53B|nr:hypothetical protein [Herbaspirillum sp. alder98]MCA1325652.1 hypothetical protein [Herbaspirillum sp. alder98]
MSDQFLDWWFSPWSYGAPAAASDAIGQIAGSTLGRRDTYRHWCAQHAVAAVLPASPDLRWQGALLRDAQQFALAASLYGGLFAARAQRTDELAALPAPHRRWCLSVALTQPLAGWTGELPAPLANARTRGALELALRLEQAFPGMWSRLRLLLPPAEHEQIAPQLRLPLPETARLRERERSCWQLCVARATAP